MMFKKIIAVFICFCLIMQTSVTDFSILTRVYAQNLQGESVANSDIIVPKQDTQEQREIAKDEENATPQGASSSDEKKTNSDSSAIDAKSEPQNSSPSDISSPSSVPAIPPADSESESTKPPSSSNTTIESDSSVDISQSSSTIKDSSSQSQSGILGASSGDGMDSGSSLSTKDTTNKENAPMENNSSDFIITAEGVLTKYVGNQANVVIPNSVTIIGEEAFLWNEFIVSVIIPEGVTEIGAFAFNLSRNLEKVTFPKSLRRINKSAFDYCYNLKSIQIPDGVSYIGPMAFNGCSALASVTLPASLSYLSSAVFAKCDNLTSITLPINLSNYTGTRSNSYGGPFWGCTNLQSVIFEKGFTRIPSGMLEDCKAENFVFPETVTHIGSYAFCASSVDELPENLETIDEYAFMLNSGLTDIRIPNKVTKIGTRAFYYSYTLKSVTLPPTITIMGDGMFQYCGQLNKVVLEEGFKRIPNETFAGCYRLESVIIPETVTEIGTRAFEKCEILQTIYIPPSVTTFGTAIFENCPKLVVKCQKGSPAANYCIENNIPYEYVNGFDSESSGVSSGLENGGVIDSVTKKTEQQFKIIAQDGKPIKDATVGILNSFDEIVNSWNSDINGIINLPKTLFKNTYVFQVSATGYQKKILILRDSKSQSPIITLNKDTNKPYIGGVILNEHYDLINQDYIVSKSEAGYKPPVKIYMFGTDKTSIQYMLAQGGSEVGRFDTNKFNIDLASSCSEYTKGGTLKITAKSENLELASVSLKVKVYNNSLTDPEPESFNMDMSLGKMKVTLPDDFPLLGGSDLNFDSKLKGLVRAECSPKNGVVKVYIGDAYAFLKDSSSNINGAITEKEKFAEALKNNINKLGKTVQKVNVGNIEGKASLFGYGEGKLSSQGNSACVKASIYLKITGKGGFQQYFLVGIVPLYATIDGKIENTSSMGLEMMLADGKKSNVSLTGSNELTLDLKAGLGVGIHDIISASITGGGNAKLNSNLVTNSNTITARFEAQVKATCVGFSVEHTWPSKTFQLYPKSNFYSSNVTRQESPMQALYQTENYTLMDRDYIMQNSNSANMAKSAQKNLLDINGVYPDAKPKLVSFKDKLYLFYLDDIASRSSINRTALVYQAYNNGKWSEKKILQDDKTADFNFEIISTADNIYVAWQNAKGVFSDNDKMDKLLSNMSLSMAKIDSNNKCEIVTLSTTSGKFLTGTALAEHNNEVYVFWQENSENSLSGASGTNTIYKQKYGSTQKTEIAKTKNPVMGLSAGVLQDKIYAVWVEDLDSNLTTQVDREIFASDSTAVKRVTDNNVLDTAPQFAQLNSLPTLFWYSENNLSYLTAIGNTKADLFASGLDDFSENYQVINSKNDLSIIWRTLNGDGEQINMVEHKNKALGTPEVVSISESPYLSLFACGDKLGNRWMTNTIKSNLSPNVTVLSVQQIKAVSDIKITDIICDENAAVSGKNFPVEISYQNISSTMPQQIGIVVKNNKNETVWQKNNIAIPNNKEEKSLISNDFIPVFDKNMDYSLHLIVDGRETDSGIINLGYSNISVEGNTYYSNMDELATISVFNRTQKTENIDVKVFTEYSDEPIIEKTYSNIKPDDVALLSCNINELFNESAANTLKVQATTLDNEEIVLEDNITYFYNTGKIETLPTVSLSSSDIVLGVGQEHTLIATITGEYTEDEISWGSDNELVATVDSFGKVSAFSQGNAKISCHVKGVSASCNVSVDGKGVLSGSVKSGTKSKGLTMRLYPSKLGNDVISKDIKTQNPANAIAVLPKLGEIIQEQNLFVQGYTFEGIANSVYKLAVYKPGNKLEIFEIEIKDSATKNISLKLMGDVAGGDSLNATDLVWLQQNILHTRSFSQEQLDMADINGNGVINATDAVWLRQRLLGERDDGFVLLS